LRHAEKGKKTRKIDKKGKNCAILLVRPKGGQKEGNKVNTEKMITRLVNKGANPVDAKKLMNELIASFSSENLIVALRYHNFITEAQAEKMQVN
jgi:polysaccharide pyruvyl transferase WcaK-like protein